MSFCGVRIEQRAIEQQVMAEVCWLKQEIQMLKDTLQAAW